VDTRPKPLKFARDFGATHSIEAGAGNAAEEVRALRRMDGSGLCFRHGRTPATISQALEGTRKGGAVVLTGLSRTDALASIPTFLFVMQEKRPESARSTVRATADDIPHLVTLYQAGKLKLRELVTRTYPLDGVNDALAALAAGEGARGIIRW